VVWSPGVDARTFSPDAAIDPGLARPVFLFVGRLAPENNIEALLGLSLPGTRGAIGDGPMRAGWKRTGRMPSCPDTATAASGEDPGP